LGSSQDGRAQIAIVLVICSADDENIIETLAFSFFGLDDCLLLDARSRLK